MRCRKASTGDSCVTSKLISAAPEFTVHFLQSSKIKTFFATKIVINHSFACARTFRNDIHTRTAEARRGELLSCHIENILAGSIRIMGPGWRNLSRFDSSVPAGATILWRSAERVVHLVNLVMPLLGSYSVVREVGI